MPLPVPAGYVLTALGTMTGSLQDSEFCAPASGSAQTIVRPLGGIPIDEALATLAGVSVATEEVDEEARAWYLGRAQADFTTAKIVVDVISATDSPTTCEVGICKGTPVLCDGASNLTLVGYADTTADWNAPGPVPTTIAGMTIATGDHIWLAWSSKKAAGHVLHALRACLPDTIMAGVFVCKAGTRLSTMAAASAFSRVSTGVRGVDAVVGLS